MSMGVYGASFASLWMLDPTTHSLMTAWGTQWGLCSAHRDSAVTCNFFVFLVPQHECVHRLSRALNGSRREPGLGEHRPPRKRTRRILCDEHRRDFVRAFKKSGQSPTAFCAERGLTRSCLQCRHTLMARKRHSFVTRVTSGSRHVAALGVHLLSAGGVPFRYLFGLSQSRSR
jgi:hypothetical protein